MSNKEINGGSGDEPKEERKQRRTELSAVELRPREEVTAQ